MTPKYPQVFLGSVSEDPEDAEFDRDQEQWCDDHWQRLANAPGAEPMMGVIALQDTLLNDGDFYEIAYRIKNGYGPPTADEVPPGEWEVPENEQPGIYHINEAMGTCAPLCCYVEDELGKWDVILEKARGEQEIVMGDGDD